MFAERHSDIAGKTEFVAGKKSSSVQVLFIIIKDCQSWLLASVKSM
jgi:hypothetical protein